MDRWHDHQYGHENGGWTQRHDERKDEECTPVSNCPRILWWTVWRAREEAVGCFDGGSLL